MNQARARAFLEYAVVQGKVGTKEVACNRTHNGRTREAQSCLSVVGLLALGAWVTTQEYVRHVSRFPLFCWVTRQAIATLRLLIQPQAGWPQKQNGLTRPAFSRTTVMPTYNFRLGR